MNEHMVIALHKREIYTYLMRESEKPVRVNEELCFNYVSSESMTIYIRGLKNALQFSDLSPVRITVIYFDAPSSAAFLAQELCGGGCSCLNVLSAEFLLTGLLHGRSGAEVLEIGGRDYVVRFCDGMSAELRPAEKNSTSKRLPLSRLLAAPPRKETKVIKEVSAETAIIDKWRESLKKENGCLDELYELMGITEKSHRRLIMSICMAYALARMSGEKRRQVKNQKMLLSCIDTAVKNTELYPLKVRLYEELKALEKAFAGDVGGNVLKNALRDLAVTEELYREDVREYLKKTIVSHSLDTIWKEWKASHE